MAQISILRCGNREPQSAQPKAAGPTAGGSRREQVKIAPDEAQRNPGTASRVMFARPVGPCRGFLSPLNRVHAIALRLTQAGLQANS